MVMVMISKRIVMFDEGDDAEDESDDQDEDDNEKKGDYDDGSLW